MQESRRTNRFITLKRAYAAALVLAILAIGGVRALAQDYTPPPSDRIFLVTLFHYTASLVVCVFIGSPFKDGSNADVPFKCG